MLIGTLSLQTQSFPTLALTGAPTYCGTQLIAFRSFLLNPAILNQRLDTLNAPYRLYIAVQPARFGLTELNQLISGITLPPIAVFFPAITISGTFSSKFTDLTTTLLLSYAPTPVLSFGSKLAFRFRRFGHLRSWIDASWSIAVLSVLDSTWRLAASFQNFPHLHNPRPEFPIYEASISTQWIPWNFFTIETGILIRTVAAPSPYLTFEGVLFPASLPFRVGYLFFPPSLELATSFPIRSTTFELSLVYNPLLGMIATAAMEYQW